MSFKLVMSEGGDAATAILAEAEEWQEIMALDAEKVLDVYLDMKSPHAYLAVRPSLEVARDYRVRLNFLPYTMSYTAIGVSKSVEPDMKRRPPSPAADRKARMYYTAARQYAALQGLPFRSPYRLLDSTLAHKAFLFAKQQGLEVPFLMRVYVQGWGRGWRDYEVESHPSVPSPGLRVSVTSAPQPVRTPAPVVPPPGLAAAGAEAVVLPARPRWRRIARLRSDAPGDD